MKHVLRIHCYVGFVVAKRPLDPCILVFRIRRAAPPINIDGKLRGQNGLHQFVPIPMTLCASFLAYHDRTQTSMVICNKRRHNMPHEGVSFSKRRWQSTFFRLSNTPLCWLGHKRQIRVLNSKNREVQMRTQ